jgi:hypothetical protein
MTDRSSDGSSTSRSTRGSKVGVRRFHRRSSASHVRFWWGSQRPGPAPDLLAGIVTKDVRAVAHLTLPLTA